MGYAYRDVANGYHVLRQYDKAQPCYEQAETILRTARDDIGDPGLKEEYTGTIRAVLKEYILLLQQTGQSDAEIQAQKRLSVEGHSENTNRH